MVASPPFLQRQVLIAIIVFLFCGIFANVAKSQPVFPANNALADLPIPATAAALPSDSTAALDGPSLGPAPSWSEALRAIVLTAIPNKYEDLRHWEKTTEVFDGLNVRQKGFEIRLKERKKRVNHGAWHRYKIELIDPANRLRLVIDQIHPTGIGQFRFDIRLTSSLRCRADFEHWVFGVKGMNMTVVSDADVQIVAHCQLALHTESHRKSTIPTLVLDPRVNGIDLSLTHLDVKRIGEIRGDIAEGIGDVSRRTIENLLKSQEGRALKKANEAIDKKRGSLRISATPF